MEKYIGNYKNLVGFALTKITASTLEGGEGGNIVERLFYPQLALVRNAIA